MKKCTFIPLLFLVATMSTMIPAAVCQDKELLEKISGSWLGSLTIKDQSLRLVLNISINEKKEAVITIDSPDQGARDIPATLSLLKGDSLVVNVPSVQGQLSGRYEDAMFAISGIWKQGGISLPIDLKRTDQKTVINRPQEPKPPFPYDVREVTIENKQAKIKLSGTLTLPRSMTVYPLVVLISGSGPENRDGELLGHKPFLVLSDFLTRNGIGVLRYDDRGTGKSGGKFETATTLDFVSDANAAVDFLNMLTNGGPSPEIKLQGGTLSQPSTVNMKEIPSASETESEAQLETVSAINEPTDIHSRRVHLIGHSEGGLVASILASQRHDISTIVLMAGPGIPGEQILLKQSEIMGKMSGNTDNKIQSELIVSKEVFAILKKYPDNPTASEKIKQLLKKNYQNLPPGDPDKMTEAEIDEMVKTVTSPWFRFFLTYDPVQAIAKVKCPVYALIGSNDFQVTPQENLEAIEKALIFGGNPNYMMEEITGINHLFQTTEDGSPSLYGKIEETMSEEVMKKISEWILSH